jgi:hypothetical protein
MRSAASIWTLSLQLWGRPSPCGGLSGRLLRNAIVFLLATTLHAAAFTYHVEGDPGPWPMIFGSMSMTGAPAASADVLVIRTPKPAADLTARISSGLFLILEGDSETARSFGFRPANDRITVRSLEDLRHPKLRLIWEIPAELPRFEVPTEARVFARERHQQAPLLAGFKRGSGAVLWIATSPGTPQGYERFPYVLQALADLGWQPPFRSSNLWAFFDSSYRARADLDFLAKRWREAGISAIHAAAWHYWERDPQADEYLKRLIEACHRNLIQVYAWLELPHVSEQFWRDHPEWREKTALQQDAQLDWRKLINLTNPAAFSTVSAGMHDLIRRFDWDGVNLAELYFESLEGHENPARFTPMNADVRAQFQSAAGFDPISLFNSPSKNTTALSRFLDFRADLARRQQAAWISEFEKIRSEKPHLDLVLTHVDDRFDPTMREKIGADVAKTLPLLNSHDFTFLVEDPATLWNLGPQRYTQIAARYAPLTTRREKLAIDINVVERYQDVYPSKQQTGTELFELLHTAASAFARVTLYFENSILAPDLSLLPNSAAAVDRVERTADKFTISAQQPIGVAWTGGAMVDGRPWPFANEQAVWLASGHHTLQPAPMQPPLRILDFNGTLKTASVTSTGVEFSYESSARAMVRFERPVSRIEIDGVAADASQSDAVLLLPRGQHFIKVGQAFLPAAGLPPGARPQR